MKKAILWVNLILLGVFVFSGCSSKKDNPAPSIKEQNMKFTLTTTGLQATDDFDLNITGGTVEGSASTLFKINGVVQNSQRLVTITNAQLRAGQVVVETNVPLFYAAVTIGGFSGTDGHTFTFKLEPVIGGTAQPTITQTFTTATYTNQYTYGQKQ
jgi:hypothetical protein